MDIKSATIVGGADCGGRRSWMPKRAIKSAPVELAATQFNDEKYNFKLQKLRHDHT